MVVVEQPDAHRLPSSSCHGGDDADEGLLYDMNVLCDAVNRIELTDCEELVRILDQRQQQETDVNFFAINLSALTFDVRLRLSAFLREKAKK